jgi:hypothetical protein
MLASFLLADGIFLIVHASSHLGLRQGNLVLPHFCAIITTANHKKVLSIATLEHEPYLVLTERRTGVLFHDSNDLTHSRK